MEDLATRNVSVLLLHTWLLVICVKSRNDEESPVLHVGARLELVPLQEQGLHAARVEGRRLGLEEAQGRGQVAGENLTAIEAHIVDWRQPATQNLYRHGLYL